MSLKYEPEGFGFRVWGVGFKSAGFHFVALQPGASQMADAAADGRKRRREEPCGGEGASGGCAGSSKRGRDGARGKLVFECCSSSSPICCVGGLWCGVEGLGFGFWWFGFWGLGLRIDGLWFRVYGNASLPD